MMIVLLRQTRDEHKGNWSLREILPQESGPVPVDKADSQVEKAEPGGGSDGDDVPMVGSDCTPAPNQPQL
jgi:hypothetical protein